MLPTTKTVVADFILMLGRGCGVGVWGEGGEGAKESYTLRGLEGWT